MEVVVVELLPPAATVILETWQHLVAQLLLFESMVQEVT